MKKPFIIGVTGGSGSGKTTFINAIKDSFTRAEVCIISQDEYYHPIEKQRKDHAGVENFDIPSSIDKKQFAKDIKKLIAGKTVSIQEYVFNNVHETPKTIYFYPAPIIVVEGIFVFHYKKIQPLLDLKIFMDAKENLKVIRRIKRDKVERNYPLEDVLHRFEHHILPSYEKYIAPHRDSADLVINNNESMEMGIKVVMGFIRQELLCK